MRKRILAMFCVALLTVTSAPEGSLSAFAAKAEPEANVTVMSETGDIAESAEDFALSTEMVTEQVAGNSAITITSQPLSVTTSAGTTAKFNVVASGNVAKYQWQVKNDATVDWKNTTVTGATTDTLSVAADVNKTGRKYRCIITDVEGKSVTSSAATLTVVAAPKITTQPANVTTVAGKSASFSVVATGTGLKYQWQVKTDANSAWKNTTVTGATTNKMTVAADVSKSGRQYRCVVTDKYGASVKSSAATLTVNSSLAITKQPANVTTVAGKKATFSVTATGEGLKYQWQVKNDANSEWKNTTVTGATTNTISVAADVSKSGRKYRCIVKDKYGNSVTSSAATLTVTEGVKITSQPEDIMTAPGKTVTFHVVAKGEGLTYQWQAKNDATVDWKNTTLAGATTDTLSVSADLNKSGRRYRCIIKDKYGASVTSQEAVLNVMSLAKITTQPLSVTGNYGTTGSLKVVAENASYYSWLRSLDGRKWEEMQESAAVSGVDSDVLKFKFTPEMEKYQYKCRIYNEVGSVDTDVVTIQWKVKKPTISSATAKGNKVTISWDKISGATYTVLYAKSGQTLKKYVTEVETTSMTIGNLENNTKYDFAVIATIEGRDSKQSSEVSVTTLNGDGNTTYRALLIGEENFSPRCTSHRTDVTLMENMLNTVRGGDGGKYAGNITKAFNQSAANIKNLIASTFAQADEDDVSLFYIATRGDTTMYGSYAGALAAVDGSGSGGYILLRDLASWLGAVPGKVIVILESSGSGAAVYEAGVPENSMNSEDFAEAFSQDAIDTFAAADAKIAEEVNYYFDAEGNAVSENTGEFRKDKFYVLCATRYQETNWSSQDDNYDWFTYWLTQGVGGEGSLPCDENRDFKATLGELFNYIKNVGNDYPFYYYDQSGRLAIGHQHVQAYPANSDFVLFKKVIE